MPADKRRPKCNWERERRERLNVSFFKLSKLLPDHDPTLTLPKVEIITKATEYINQLKNENMQLIIDSDNITGAQKNEMNHLKQRVTDLLRRTRQLADLLQAADIPIPSEMPPHESEFPLKRPSKWSGRINKDAAKDILENIKKKREEKEKIHKEKQKASKEKKSNNNLKKLKKSKSKTLSTPVKVSEKYCALPNLLGVSTSNIITPLREINNSLPEKTYSKTLTVPCTSISLVISNTKTSIVSVAKSNILTAPIMATGIQPVLERNPALSNLGPGTLILPDGRIMPVPPPTQTVLGATQFIVNRPTQPAVIVMQNNLTAIKQGKTQRVLVPKPKLKDSTKTTYVNKVPIPAIKSNDQRYINKDHLIVTNVKKQKVKSKKVKASLNISTNGNNSSTIVNSNGNKTQKNIEVKISCDKRNSSRSKKRVGDSDSIPSKRIKINDKDDVDKLKIEKNKLEKCSEAQVNKGVVSTQSGEKSSHKNKETGHLKMQKETKTVKNDVDSNKLSVSVSDNKNKEDNKESAQSNDASIQAALGDKVSENSIIKIQTDQSVICNSTDVTFENQYQGIATSCNVTDSALPKTLDSGSTFGEIVHTSQVANITELCKTTGNTTQKSDPSSAESVVLEKKLTLETTSTPNKPNGEHGNHPHTSDSILQTFNTLSSSPNIQSSVSKKIVDLKGVKTNDLLDPTFVGSKLDDTTTQNISDAMSFNSFIFPSVDQKTNNPVSSGDFSYAQHVDARSILCSQNPTDVKNISTPIGQSTSQSKEIRHIKKQNDFVHGINITEVSYQLPMSVHLGTNSQICQTTTTARNITCTSENIVQTTNLRSVTNHISVHGMNTVAVGNSVHNQPVNFINPPNSSDNSILQMNDFNSRQIQNGQDLRNSGEHSKNNFSDYSVQTNMNVTDHHGFKSPTNTLNDNSANQTIRMQNDQPRVDFRTDSSNILNTNRTVGNTVKNIQPSMGFRSTSKNTIIDSSLQQTNMTTNSTKAQNDQPNQRTDVHFLHPTNSKNTKIDTVPQGKTNSSAVSNTVSTQNNQDVNFRGSKMSHDNTVHDVNKNSTVRNLPSDPSFICKNTQNDSVGKTTVSGTTINNSTRTSTDASTMCSVTDNHPLQTNLVPRGNVHGHDKVGINPRPGGSSSINQSVEFRNNTFNPHSVVNRTSVGTLTGSQSDKSYSVGNIDFRSSGNSTNTPNDRLVHQANIDFNVSMASNTQNSSIQTRIDSSIKSSMEFRNPPSNVNTQNKHSVHQGPLVSSAQSDMAYQKSSEFRSASTARTHRSVPANIDIRGAIGVKSSHNIPVQNMDFRASMYTSTNNTVCQPNMNSGSLNITNINDIHQRNTGGTVTNVSQTSMTYGGPTFSSNNSVCTTTTSDSMNFSNQSQHGKPTTTQLNQKGVSTNLNPPQSMKDPRCVPNCNFVQLNTLSTQKIKDVNVAVTNPQITSASYKSTQTGTKTAQPDQKNIGDENLLNSHNSLMTHCDVKDSTKDPGLHGRGKIGEDKTKLSNEPFSSASQNADVNGVKGDFGKRTELEMNAATKQNEIQNFTELKTVDKENQKHDFNTKKANHEMLTESMKMQTCTENVFRDLNYRDRNTFVPINHCMDEMRLTLSNTDFSNDLFSSLQVPTGGQHPESISPTAAFLLAFPLVSTSKTSEILAENENSDSQHATPTTILQIGNIDPPGSELYQSVESSLQFQNVKTKRDDKLDKSKPVESFGRFQNFEMNDKVSQNYANFRVDDSFEKSCKQKKPNYMTLQDQELFLPCEKKKNDKNCPYLAQSTGNFTGVEFQTQTRDAQNIQQNSLTNQPMNSQKKPNATNIPSSQYSYNASTQPYYNLFSSNNEFPASVTSNFTTTQASNEQQKVTTQNSNQNNFSSVLSWTMPMTTTTTSNHEYTTPFTTFSQKQPYSNQTNTKANHLQTFERKEKQNSTLPKFSTNFQFGNNARYDLPQNQTNDQLYKDSKTKKSKSNQPRPPVNWMTTPDIRPVLSDHMSTILPDVMFPTKDLDLIPPQNTILNSCSNIPPFTSIANNQTFYPNSHFSGIDLPLDLPPFPEIATKQNRNNQQSSQYSWSPNKTIPLLPHIDNHTLAIPSTLPTLIGDLALGTNTGPPTPAENFKNYPLQNNFTGNIAKKCDTKQECPKNLNKSPEKGCLVTTNERRNPTRSDYCKTLTNQSTNTSGSFLSVSQLVDQVKSDRNVQRRGTKTVCKPPNTQKRSNVQTDKHNMKNVPMNNYPSHPNNNAMQQRKNENHFPDERNKNLGYPGTFPSNVPPPWQDRKTNTNTAQFKGGSYSAESLIGVNSDTNIMNHDNLPEISQFPPSNQFTNQYNKPFTDAPVSTSNTYNADFTQNIQHGTDYAQTQQSYQNCFNFPQNSIYTSTTTAPFMESDYQLSLDSSYVFHHPSTNTCQTNVKDRTVQPPKRTNKRREDYTPLPVNQPVSTFLQTSQMYPSSSQYVNARNSSTYQPTSSCASGSNTTSSLAHHGTTTLANFNLSTIFPEINDKRAVSGTNTYHTNGSKHDVNASVAQPGVRPEYSVTTDSVDNRLPSMRPGFNNTLLPQQTGAPPPPTSHFSTEGFNNITSTPDSNPSGSSEDDF